MESAILLNILEQLCILPSETATVEFKSGWTSPEEIGQYISALANSAALEGHDRAWLIWGVDDRTHEVIGTAFDPFSAKGAGRQSLVMWLTQRLLPRPDFVFHEVQHPNGKVVMLEIFPPRDAPLAFERVRYIRIGDNKTQLHLHWDKEARLWEAFRRSEDWTGEIVPDAVMDDLDPEALVFAREKFAEYLTKMEPDPGRHPKIRSEAAEWDTVTFLNKALVTKQGRVTRSALILLGREEAVRFLSPAETKISWVLRDEHNRPLGGRHFGPPMLQATEAVFRCVRNVTLEYMANGALFPIPVSQYDPWVIREALHNCIAHQDYRLGGKINVTEHPDRLVFTNLGAFLPPSVEWMLEHQSPPERYRNQWLIGGMVRLRMIDQLGSGIRRMFETQRERFFPLPDYTIDSNTGALPRVEVSIPGKILDINYTQALMRKKDLSLRQVMLLDRVQKRRPVSPPEAKALRAEGLIEGRSPNYYISAEVAEWTDRKAGYIRNRGLDDEYYQRLIIEYLRKYARAERKELADLVTPKMAEVLTREQRQHKLRNLIQVMRRKGLIRNDGAKKSPVWVLASPEFIAKTPEKDPL